MRTATAGEIHLTVALVFAITGCSTPAEPEHPAMCAAVVQVQGILYTAASPQAAPPTGLDQSEPFATVTLHDPTCDDALSTNESAEFSMQDGESNFLPVGTPLYAIDGYPATDRLATETQDGWVLLTAASTGP